tara:strand:- start:154 stop:417 length:264 start_codon:yes stop_codon:yes gene_type:complete
MKMGLRKQQNLLHWLNKKLSSFFSRFKPCAATTSWQEKVTRKFYWPDRSSCVFFFFENPLSPPFQYWSGNFFTTGSFAVCGNDRKLG